MRKQKKMEEERKRGKKRKTPQNCKSPMQRQRFIRTIESVTKYIYTYTYTPIRKIKIVQKKIKYNRLTQQTKETKNYIYQNETN